MEPSDAQRSVVTLLQCRYGKGEALYQNWDAAEFLHAFGSVPAALLHAALLVPEFIEIEGAVFLRDLGVKPAGGMTELAEQVRQHKAASPERLKAFVDSYNWIELPYVFADRAAVDEECTALAALVVDAWRARLRDLYPHRQFGVRVIDPHETGSVIGIGFEQDTLE
jgi:hypothetical protein